MGQKDNDGVQHVSSPACRPADRSVIHLVGTSTWPAVVADLFASACAYGRAVHDRPWWALASLNDVASQLFAEAVPAPSGALYADDFNRANGALGSPWVAVDGGLVVASNKATAPDGNLHTSRYNQTITADHWAEADLSGLVPGATMIGPCVRFTGQAATSTTRGSMARTSPSSSGSATTVHTQSPDRTDQPWEHGVGKCRFEAQGYDPADVCRWHAGDHHHRLSGDHHRPAGPSCSQWNGGDPRQLPCR